MIGGEGLSISKENQKILNKLSNVIYLAGKGDYNKDILVEAYRCIEKLTIALEASYKTEERLESDLRELRRKQFRRFDDDEYWIFMDDGEDYPESLICPVVISAQQFRDFMSLRDKLEDLKEV